MSSQWHFQRSMWQPIYKDQIDQFLNMPFIWHCPLGSMPSYYVSKDWGNYPFLPSPTEVKEGSYINGRKDFLR